MEFGIFELLKLIGALGFFIFGMKVMSDGIQKVAGSKMRSILSKMTSNRFLGITTGVLITALLQSSSATTVMIVSFVNACYCKNARTFHLGTNRLWRSTCFPIQIK